MEIVGRRVIVRDEAGDRVCFLKGERAVIGDRVVWEPVPGEGGRLVSVAPRDTALTRMDPRGREQVLAANLRGLLLVQSARHPGFRPALVDRYQVAAEAAGLELVLVLNKSDLGLPEADAAALAHRESAGLRVLRTSAARGDGVEALRAFLAERAEGGPWALVGGSGVGKTTLAAALLPDVEVGPIGDVSEYWDTGRHTTTGSRLFTLAGGGELVDSPGIRSFTPQIDSEAARLHFPLVEDLRCQYRDCLHRPGEDGCAAEGSVPPELLDSYRTLLGELLSIEGRQTGAR